MFNEGAKQSRKALKGKKGTNLPSNEEMNEKEEKRRTRKTGDVTRRVDFFFFFFR
jgi:hypothetical protein